jgi:acyl carrier protein
MNEEEILIEIKKVLIEDFEVEDDVIKPEASFYDDLGLDSLDAIDLIVTMNNVFNIDVENKEIENTHTIKQLIVIVKKNLK